MNPLECLERKREEILKEYERVLCVGLGVSSTGNNDAYIFRKQKEADLSKIKDIIEQYEATILVLKALNEYEYLKEE